MFSGSQAATNPIPSPLRYLLLIYTKTVDRVIGALKLATETRDSKYYSPLSICARKVLTLTGINELKIVIFHVILSHCFSMYYNNY